MEWPHNSKAYIRHQKIERRQKRSQIIDTSVDQILFVPAKNREEWNTLGTPLPEVERVAWIFF